MDDRHGPSVGNREERVFDAACDIGTTTVACYLTDVSGEVMGAGAASNPQAMWGSDVISRIVRADEGQAALDGLSDAVRRSVDRLISGLAGGLGLEAKDCRSLTVAGNSVMELLFMGVSPSPLGRAPFALPQRSFEPRRAEELGLSSLPEDALVYALPLMDAFVGGDTAAVLYEVTEDAASRGDSDATRLVIDLGTNGEIALLSGGRATVCSTAAGPAFEGVGIKCGMPAIPGAVTALVADAGSVYCRTVGGEPARGVCGSGLVDAVALLLREGVLDGDGRMDGSAPSFLARRVRGEGADRRCALCESASGEVAIYQSDVRKFQLAKGAVQAGVEVLLAHCGVQNTDIDECVLAGAFGSAIRHESLIETGLLPSSLGGRVRSIGNGAGHGTVRMIRDGDEGRIRLERLTGEAHHIRLETAPRFQSLFLDAMRLAPR